MQDTRHTPSPFSWPLGHTHGTDEETGPAGHLRSRGWRRRNWAPARSAPSASTLFPLHPGGCPRCQSPLLASLSTPEPARDILQPLGPPHKGGGSRSTWWGAVPSSVCFQTQKTPPPGTATLVPPGSAAGTHPAGTRETGAGRGSPEPGRRGAWEWGGRRGGPPFRSPRKGHRQGLGAKSSDSIHGLHGGEGLRQPCGGLPHPPSKDPSGGPYGGGGVSWGGLASSFPRAGLSPAPLFIRQIPANGRPNCLKRKPVSQIWTALGDTGRESSPGQSSGGSVQRSGNGTQPLPQGSRAPARL